MGVDAEDCRRRRPPRAVRDQLPERAYRPLPEPLRHPIGSSGGPPSALFAEASAGARLVADSRPWVGWGCALADFDNDGWPDAFVANGHVDENRKDLAPTLSYPEPPLAVPQRADGRRRRRRFQLATRGAGPYFVERHVGRGAAFGDIDDDGDIDIVVNHKDGPPALLRNDTPPAGRWIRLKLVGTRSNRDAIGAVVKVEAEGAPSSGIARGEAACSRRTTPGC